jgi:hypothetical protein
MCVFPKKLEIHSASKLFCHPTHNKHHFEQDVQRVAIKGLLKSVLEAARQRDEAEDPECEFFS